MFPNSVPGIRNEDGFQLMSLVIAVAISAMIISGIVITINHLYDVSSDRTSQLVAVREVQNAGSWLTRDAEKASEISVTYDADGFPLTLTWTDSDENEHEAVYTLLPTNRLQREHYINKITNPDPDATTLLASYIDLDNTSCSISANNELVACITATVNIEAASCTETRTYRIFPRGCLQ